MKKPLSELTKSDYETLKLTGLLWEIYPDAPDTYEGIMSKHDEGLKHTPCKHKRVETIDFDTVMVCLDCGHEEVIKPKYNSLRLGYVL